MYALLTRWLPPIWAAAVTTLWYAALIIAIILRWQGGDLFRYGRI